MTYKELFVDNKDVLIIHKSLASILGDLNEAVVLNQLNYWIERYKETNHNFKDGKYWVYNSYKQWAVDNFPFWSETTVKRTFTRLENKGIVISANYNQMPIDKTKWYSIDYKKLQKYIDKHTTDQNERASNHKDQSTGQNDFSSGHNEKAIPENTTDTTNKDCNTDNTSNSTSNDVESLNSPFSKMEGPELRSPKIKNEEKSMPIRALEITDEIFESENMSNNVRNFVKYFLEKRKKAYGADHVPLSRKTLKNIILTITDEIVVYYTGKDYCTVCDPLISEWDDDNDYKEIVDAYFEQKFKVKVDYSLSHFAQKNVLSTLMMKVDRNKWCRNENCGFAEE